MLELILNHIKLSKHQDMNLIDYFYFLFEIFFDEYNLLFKNCKIYKFDLAYLLGLQVLVNCNIFS